MKYKKIILLGILLLPLISITSVKADVIMPPESLETGNTAFYLCAVNTSQTLELNLTHDGIGNFTMYLLYNRPLNTNMEEHYILRQALNDEPSIIYTAPEDKIYYLQVNLVSGGPDIYTISSSHQLIRYYLPQIPGFPLEFIFISLISGFGLVYFAYKRKVKEL